MIKILNRRPKEYLEQGLTQCGAFSVKAIISAYGKDDGRRPRDYNATILGKLFSLVGTKTWLRVLRSYGLNAERGETKNLSNEERLKFLKETIDHESAIMIRIGNGFLKNGQYNPLVAYFVGHWITLWGYDDEKQIFYIYDSYVPLARHNKTIPIGNTIRTFSEVLRDWGKGFPPIWWYGFIKVSSS